MEPSQKSMQTADSAHLIAFFLDNSQKKFERPSGLLKPMNGRSRGKNSIKVSLGFFLLYGYRGKKRVSVRVLDESVNPRGHFAHIV